MKPGDLYWVEFPVRGGHAQAGHRPAVIWQAAEATAQMDALRFPGTVLVEVDSGNGLRRPSVALAFQLTAVDKQFVETHLGQLSETVRSAIAQALDDVTGRS